MATDDADFNPPLSQLRTASPDHNARSDVMESLLKVIREDSPPSIQYGYRNQLKSGCWVCLEVYQRVDTSHYGRNCKHYAVALALRKGKITRHVMHALTEEESQERFITTSLLPKRRKLEQQ